MGALRPQGLCKRRKREGQAQGEEWPGELRLAPVGCGEAGTCEVERLAPVGDGEAGTCGVERLALVGDGWQVGICGVWKVSFVGQKLLAPPSPSLMSLKSTWSLSPGFRGRLVSGNASWRASERETEAVLRACAELHGPSSGGAGLAGIHRFPHVSADPPAWEALQVNAEANDEPAQAWNQSELFLKATHKSCACDVVCVWSGKCDPFL